MKPKWIGSGWKMNLTMAQARHFAESLHDYYADESPSTQVFIVPPFPYLLTVGELLQGTPVRLAAQNMHWEDSGAFTGEVSPVMLKDCGVRIVELGHAERRTLFGETDQIINRKVLATLKHGMRPLICVGESRDDKQCDVGVETLSRQLKIALMGVSEERVSQVMIAYEPVWAIGVGGEPADPAYCGSLHTEIRNVLAGLFGAAHAGEIPILYGGSVDLTNAGSYLQQDQVDGLFVGRAARKVEDFIKLIEMANTLSSAEV